MTAVDNLIAELQGNSSTDYTENYRGTVATFVAALQQLQGGLVPGAAAANTVFAGPVTGAAAAPAFRVLTANDLAAVVTLTAGAILFGSATGGAIPASLSWDDTNKVLQLGGTTAAFAGLKRSGTSLVASLADNSADTVMQASAFVPSGAAVPAIGMYNSAANTIGFAMSSAVAFTMNASFLQGSSSAGAAIVQGIASSTAPGLVPRRSSVLTGIGSQAAGNFSGIVVGTEVWRTTAAGFLMQGSAGITFGAGALFNDYEEGTWTPIDSSGAGLTFSGVTTRFTKTGRMVNAEARIIYPVNVSAVGNVIGGLPFTVPNAFAAAQGFLAICQAATARYAYPTINNTTLMVLDAAEAALLNSTLSNSEVAFTALYPNT